MDTSRPQSLLQTRLDGSQSVTRAIHARSSKDVRDVHYTVSAKFDCSAGFREHCLCFVGEGLPLEKHSAAVLRLPSFHGTSRRRGRSCFGMCSLSATKQGISIGPRHGPSTNFTALLRRCCRAEVSPLVWLAALSGEASCSQFFLSNSFSYVSPCECDMAEMRACKQYES